jgi:hypothetical protein
MVPWNEPKVTYVPLQTDPNVINLGPNSYYIVEFDYRIVDRGTTTGSNVLNFAFQPVNSSDPKLSVTPLGLLKNAESTGRFSAGALTANATNYILKISAAGTAIVVIDNIRILQQNSLLTQAQPARWASLASAPYPRLGKYYIGDTYSTALLAQAEQAPLTYTQKQIEGRLAFSDVLVGINVNTQTVDAAFSRRLRQLNPNLILQPYRTSEE